MTCIWSFSTETSLTLGLCREDGVSRGGLAWVPAARFSDLAAEREAFLSSVELGTYGALEFPKRRTSYLLGRYAAKRALCRMTGERDGRVFDIYPGVFHQPIVRACEGIGSAVSISHNDAGAWALAFPEGHPMGLDAEPIVASRVEVMKSQILERELQAAAHLVEHEAKACALIWTAKEALSKALRCGMMCPFELMDVEHLSVGRGVVEGRFRNFGQYRFQSWFVEGLVLSIVLPWRTELALEGFDAK